MTTNEFTSLRNLLFLLKHIHIHPGYFLIPVLLSLSAAAFEGVGMGLLIPMLEGFFTRDFSFLKETPMLQHVVSPLPDAATTDRGLFVFLLIIFIIVVVFKNALRYAASVSMAFLGYRALHHLRKVIFHRYLRFGKLYFDQTNVGHHNTVLSEFTVRAFMPVIMIDKHVNALFSLLVYLVVIVLISWKLTLATIPLFLVLHVVVRGLLEHIRHLSHSIAERTSMLGKKTVEILSTISLVKVMHTESEEGERYGAISDEWARTRICATAVQELVRPLQELIVLAALLIIIVVMLYLMVQGGQTSAPSFLVYFYVILNATGKFGSLTGFRTGLSHASGPLQEVMKVFDEEGKQYVPEGARTFEGLRERITMQHLSFTYPDGRQALNDLSFSIGAGTMTAIVGQTGGGKTTLINLLLRFYDSPPGTILLDGVDIREFTTDSLLSRMALVSQETLLLHDSLRSNITYGIDHVSDEELQRALRSARLIEFIASLPQGLETLIGDRGVKLSGGEKQRVSIARALLKGADILILDEATSSLDSRTEKLIQEAIDEARRGRTMIVIAHRLSTIRNADRIVVLRDGRCTEAGTLDGLLGKKGEFFALWEEQKFS